MTPQERRQKLLAEIFQAGRENASTFPPLTQRQREQVAFLIAPRVADPNRQPAELPQAA